MTMTRTSRIVRATTLRRPPIGGYSLSRLRLKGRLVRTRLDVVLKIGFCVGVAAVIVGSLMPADLMPVIMNDKLEHLLAYALLSSLGTLIFHTRRAMALLVLSLWALSVVLEAGQQFSPGRSTEIADALVSCLGACTAPALKLLISRRSP